MQQQINYEVIDGEIVFDNGETPFFFAPSISKTRTVNGKSYIVKSYFKGGKDFNETVKRLAVKQAYKQAR